ncbi:hypothetical protein PLICRDRAFT_164662 [Plicaturopsis crispa FD-325 SS-3]|nr:hypothetical protein PLICRDRAFT_164662 [Plicaturopsis crispa FD-325 SS-3]
MSSIGPELPPHLLARPKSTEADKDDSPPPPATVNVGPQIPPELLQRPQPTVTEDEDEDEDDYVPQLPPDLIASRAGPSKRPVIGPSFPSAQDHDRRQDDDSDDDVGPMPLPAGYSYQQGDAVREFMEKEERRRKQVEEASKPKTLKRDEWMLVPPTSSDLLGSLDPTKLKARQFARTSAPAKKVDNSLWTETPAERQQRIADEVSGKKRRAANADEGVTPEEALEARKKRKLDEQIRRGVEEHTRKVRGSTLVDMHEKGSAPEAGDDAKKGIWDHSRDMSLGGRLMDDKTRSKMLQDAKGLGDRFGTGKSGGFL